MRPTRNRLSKDITCLTDRSFTHHICSCSLEFSTQTTAAAFGASITRHCTDSTTLHACPVLTTVSLKTQNFSLSTIHSSLYVLFAPSLVGSLTLWPIYGFHILQSFSLRRSCTSFVLKKLAPISNSCLAGLKKVNFEIYIADRKATTCI